MNQPLLVPRGSSLVLRAGIVTAVVLAFFGVATGLVPLSCLFGACGPQAATHASAGAGTDSANPSGARAALEATASNEAPTTPQAMAGLPPATPAPTPDSNDLIAGSFALLPAELQKIPEPLKPLAPTAATGKTGRAESAALTTRKVRAVAVKPDGTPNLPSGMAEAYAAPAPSADEGPTPAALAAEAAATGDVAAPAETPAPPPTPPAAEKPAEKPATPHEAGSTGVVKGGGVNVRSSPNKGANSVLYSLNGGAQVTIGESEKGWLHITDKDGRRGWVYKDFVNAD